VLSVADSLLTIIPFLFGPTIGAFIMTAATEGRPGPRRLLASYARWRVKPIGYPFAAIGISLVYTLGILVVPGAVTSDGTAKIHNLLFYHQVVFVGRGKLTVML
jgi:hypothetical protein